MAETISDLFTHQLEDILYAEREIMGALEELSTQTDDPDIRDSFETHYVETEQHINRLEEVFKLIDETPEEEACEGIEGLIEEQQAFAGENPDSDVLDVFNVSAAEKVEHYEIAAYGNLAFLADELGHDQAADLLGENLEEEKRMLDQLKELTEQYDYGKVLAR